MYADYAVCEAANYRTKHKGGFLPILQMYDIFCSWAVYFAQRVARNPYLSFPDLMNRLWGAIGKFHLGAHIPPCFFRYALNFTLGAGDLDGEIIETVWAAMNRMAVMTRCMSLAHRREVLNDFVLDMNFKKLIGMGESYTVYLL
jgi:hypothetical protein